MNRSVPALVLAACLLTAACAAGATPSQPAGSSSPATSPAAASVLPSTAASVVPSAGLGDGTALCGFLESEIPALQKAGSTGGAVAQLAIDYANWIEADASRVLPDAAAMDTLTKASCPDIRTTVLKVIGSDSFANGF